MEVSYYQAQMSTMNRTNWKQRQAEKDSRAAELEQQKRTAKTEENFPTTLASETRRVVSDGPDLAERILEAHIKEEVRKRMTAYHTAASERERRNIVNGVYIFRRGRATEDEEYEDEYVEKPMTMSQQFPPHGKRGYYGPPDGEGWRLATKRCRRKHVMTNAELERAAALDDEDNSEEGDHNGDLSERNQRRDFY